MRTMMKLCLQWGQHQCQYTEVKNLQLENILEELEDKQLGDEQVLDQSKLPLYISHRLIELI